MRPTSSELLDAIDVALTTRVMPAVDDPVVQSELRSMLALVRHLKVRVDAEPALLVAEAVDLTGLLRAGGHTPADRPSLDQGDLVALAAYVEGLRQLLDEEVAEGGSGPDRMAAIDGYLRRSAARYRPLFADPFSRGWS